MEDRAKARCKAALVKQLGVAEEEADNLIEAGLQTVKLARAAPPEVLSALVSAPFRKPGEKAK